MKLLVWSSSQLDNCIWNLIFRGPSWNVSCLWLKLLDRSQGFSVWHSLGRIVNLRETHGANMTHWGMEAASRYRFQCHEAGAWEMLRAGMDLKTRMSHSVGAESIFHAISINNTTNTMMHLHFLLWRETLQQKKPLLSLHCIESWNCFKFFKRKDTKMFKFQSYRKPSTSHRCSSVPEIIRVLFLISLYM